MGADITAVTDNVTRGTFDLRLINNDLGGYRSELRSDLRVGYLTQASTEYYRLLRPNGLFVQPHTGLLRQPVYIFDNQQRIAERLQQNAGGGLDFGRTYHSRSQLAAEWRYEAVRWHTQSGDDFRPDLSGTMQTGVLHYNYNSLNAGQLSTRGLLFDIAGGGTLSRACQSERASCAVNTIYSRDFYEKNIVGLAFSADSISGRNVADPLRFTLGGPLRLSASSIDEYRGTDDMLARAGYLPAHRVAAYTIGRRTVHTGRLRRRRNMVAGAAGISAAGWRAGGAGGDAGWIHYAGWCIGDAGRRKIFFTFGRLF